MDEEGNNYSEKTVTFETEEGWITIPSVDADGNEMSQQQLEEFVQKNGPIDPVTGDPLPLFESVEDAERYAKERTDDLGDEMMEMRLGGVSEARKGIKSEAGEEAADEQFQLDEAKADLDGDGELSSYERARGEAVQKAMADDDVVEAMHGGYMMDGGCGCEECSGGMMSPDMMLGHVGFDPISGNPVPAGSDEENVRDDIPAVLSDGEYVVPADVVRYHGLKTFMALRDEAKLGLMAMQMEGQIQTLDDEYEYEEEDDEAPEPDGEEFEIADIQDTDSDTEEGEGQLSPEYETPEGNVVEVATNKIVDNLPTMKPRIKVALIS